MNRTEQREQAFILLFETNFFNYEEVDELINVYNDEHEEQVCEYAKEILSGVHEKSEELNAIIEQFSNGWKLKRIPKVNLSILRLALYEINYVENVPDSVSVNEAVELAKKYSDKSDSAFINGILGSYIRSK